VKQANFPSRYLVAAMAAACVHFSAGAASEALNETDAAFLKTVAQDSQFDIRASEMAQTHSDDERLKEYAETSVADNKRIERQLITLAEEKNVQLPSSPDKAQQAELKKLEQLKGKDFDQAYVKHLGSAYQFDLVERFKRTAERSVDVDVRGFARTNLPRVNIRYSMVNSLTDRIAPEALTPSKDTAPQR